MTKSPRTAVILFNLGGPDNLEAVQPFLFNLFYDPAIISLPNPFRYLLAKLISSRRNEKASGIYKLMGGKSPIVEQTQSQASALEKSLANDGEYKVFFFMRYWKPFVQDIIAEVKKFNPEQIVLLPLYPQFSTTTTSSGFKNWKDNIDKEFKNIPIKSPCCYYDHPKFVEAYAEGIKNFYSKAKKVGVPRILFSAHGIPKNRIQQGDPYEFQIGKSVEGIVNKLAIDGLDYVICYQSKVGPLEWLGPSTEVEIKRAAADGVPIIIVPVAFVSEHSETLVELDMEYKHLAEELGIKGYFRVPAITTNPHFIECLKDQVLVAQSRSCGFAKCGENKVA
jgi:protoporphyrin/coproporphyrin ferrochelatase